MSETSNKLATVLRDIEEGRKSTGRSCGECSMCCKLTRIDVPELKKPSGTWCQHCRPGKGGCSIYETRPDICKGFACLWLVAPEFGEEWKPSQAKIVIHSSREAEGLVCHFIVDPAFPNRWREAPYYETIKRIARNGLDQPLEEHWKTYIKLGSRTILVLPQTEVDVTGRPFLVAPTGEREWDVMLFESKEQAQRVIDKLNAFAEHVAALPPAQRDQLVAEARRLQRTQRGQP